MRLMWLDNRMCSPLWHHCSNISVHFYSSGDAKDLWRMQPNELSADAFQSGNTSVRALTTDMLLENDSPDDNK